MHGRLYTIAPNANFLETLAKRLLDGTLLGTWPKTGPFWLADVTIFLPTARARFGLADALSRLGAGLLPDIRTFGGEVAEEEPFLPPFDATPLPAAVPVLQRRLRLTSLIAAWANTPAGAEAFASPPNIAEMLALADSLGTLIDDLLIEGVAPDRLKHLAAERELAANWQQTLQFLNIALEHWPAILIADGKAETAFLRNERLGRQAAHAGAIYGDRPVIAAGSTGSIPATAGLLAAIMALPRGAVVLPGLDTTLTPKQHEALLDEKNGPHGHPQYGLARLLRRLGQTPHSVIELADVTAPRTQTVRHALALPDDTAHWFDQRQTLAPDLPGATDGISILAARTQDEEARAIAIAARQALVQNQSVGIICPDQTLARRIVAELGRFEIAIDDAAGTPLYQSPAGRLTRQVLTAAANGFAAVDVMALLQNRAVQFDMPRTWVSQQSQLLELRLLRGHRLLPGMAGLRHVLEQNVQSPQTRAANRLTPDQAEQLTLLFDKIEAAFAPLSGLLTNPHLSVADLAEALAAALAALLGPTPASLPGHDELLAWVEQARVSSSGLIFAPHNLDAVLFGLMNGFDVRSQQVRRQDIAIWGQLEARLQNRDFTILAGLNEDIWPRPADPGPWLSRGMRIDAGLEPPERDQGRAAHDFEMALGNGKVLLAYAERLGSSPGLPSRFLQRFEAFIGKQKTAELHARGAVFQAVARAIDAVLATTPAPRPMPSPLGIYRPRQLSITEVETLFRSPYDIYAKHVLKLRPLDALGEDPGTRERGSMIHAVFARFVQEDRDIMAPDAIKVLEVMATKAFAGLDAIGERRDIWLRRFATAAHGFLDFERRRQSGLFHRYAEIDGRWQFPDLDGFVLTGRADRVDVMTDSLLQIIDFKTGTVPQPRDMRNFEAPQLLLEAAMARAVGMKDLSPAAVSALMYIKIGLGPDAFKVSEFKLEDDHTLASATDEVVRRLKRHVVELLLMDNLPMTAGIRPDLTKRYRGAYDHLARTDEWMRAAGDAL